MAAPIARVLFLAIAFAACSPDRHAPSEASQIAAPAESTPSPEARGTSILHGHNDYFQRRPLLAALELGLGSIEADIFLEDGELRVGHERWQLRPGRTLRSMYLGPLTDHLQRLGRDALSKDPARPFVLLVDIKADGEAVYAALREELAAHAEILTRFVDGRIERGPVTVVLSGARPIATLAAERDRLCALDGRLADLDADHPPSLMPWISDAWTRVSDWRGRGEFSTASRERIAALAAAARAKGQELRFWGAPDRPEAWQALAELGVSRIGTDQPARAANWARGAR